MKFGVAYFAARLENLRCLKPELRDTHFRLDHTDATVRVSARVQHAALHEAVRAAEAGGAEAVAADGQCDARLSRSVLRAGDATGQPDHREVSADVGEGAESAAGAEISALLQESRPQAALSARHAGEGCAQQGEQAQV